MGESDLMIPPASEAVAHLLPLIFAGDDIPAQLLSPTTSLTHTYLNLTPASIHYYCLVPSPQLTSRWQQLQNSGLQSATAGLPWYILDDGAVRARLELKQEAGPITLSKDRIYLDLQWSESLVNIAAPNGSLPVLPPPSPPLDHDPAHPPPSLEPRWLFQTLSLASFPPSPTGQGGWTQSLSTLLSSIPKQPASRTQQAAPAPIPLPPKPTMDDFLPSTSAPTSPTRYHPQSGMGTGLSIGIPAAKKAKTAEEMAEGEGTTPGAYGAAEDFWDGWSDDEGGAGDTGNSLADKEDDEDDYWSRYGEEDTGESAAGGDAGHVIGTIDEEEEEPEDDHEQDEGGAALDRRPSITRSRRSSTIRAPQQPLATPPPPASTTTQPNTNEEGSSPYFPPLPLSDYLSPVLLPSGEVQHQPLKSISGTVSPALVPLPPTTTTTTTSSSESQNQEHEQQPTTNVSNVTIDSETELTPPAPSTSFAFARPVSSSSSELSLGNDEQSLEFALAGLWGLYSAGAKGDWDERERRQRVFERLAGRVVRS
ncbi:hypothetical protein T439DRAFT_326724 [Meredithblackwellia eburnea MCA 4105]